MGCRRLVAPLFATLVLPALAFATPMGGPNARRALELCREAEARTGAERVDMLERGLRLAEAAVQADARDAAAHFAVFCNLGRRLEGDGVGLRSLVAVRRLRAEIDAALAHAPGDPDVLLAKAALLLRLPRLLGGDPDEGERLLQQALRAAPDHPGAPAVHAIAAQSR